MLPRYLRVWNHYHILRAASDRDCGKVVELDSDLRLDERCCGCVHEDHVVALTRDMRACWHSGFPERAERILRTRQVLAAGSRLGPGHDERRLRSKITRRLGFKIVRACTACGLEQFRLWICRFESLRLKSLIVLIRFLTLLALLAFRLFAAVIFEG